MPADRPGLKDTRGVLPPAHFHCPRCHCVAQRLTEHAELLAGGEIRHVLCDVCVAALRRDPIVVLDFVRELAS
jgi:hypothetical protein